MRLGEDHGLDIGQFPTDPIDCVTLRRSNGCMLSINAIDVPELVFRLEGDRIFAVSQGRTTSLKMPNREVETDVLRMLRADPKSVYLVEIDACGDVVLTHDIGTAT